MNTKHTRAYIYIGGTNQAIIDTCSEDKESRKKRQEHETLPHHFHEVASETN